MPRQDLKENMFEPNTVSFNAATAACHGLSKMEERERESMRRLLAHHNVTSHVHVMCVCAKACNDAKAIDSK